MPRDFKRHRHWRREHPGRGVSWAGERKDCLLRTAPSQRGLALAYPRGAIAASPRENPRERLVSVLETGEPPSAIYPGTSMDIATGVAMSVTPDRILLRKPSWYARVRGADAQKSEPVGADRWKGILVLLLLIVGFFLVLAFWPR